MSTEQATSLPPAGDARREELKRRYDALTQEADKLKADLEIESIDPSAFEVENDIAQHFDPATKMLEVSNPNSSFVYRWEQADIYVKHGGVFVTIAKSYGWEVVSTSGNVEGHEHRGVDGTRRVGDAILMRIRKDRFIALEINNRRRRLARRAGVSVKALELADRAGIKLHDLNDSSTPEHVRNFAIAQAAAATAAREAMVSNLKQVSRGGKRVLAAELANKRLEKAIRAGTVPGMPAPGVSA